MNKNGLHDIINKNLSLFDSFAINNELIDFLKELFAVPIQNIFIKGSILNRLVFVFFSNHYGIVFTLKGISISKVWKISSADIMIKNPKNSLSEIKLTTAGFYLLSRPKINIVGLYKREFFPLPRFPLGISDLASSIRQNMFGEVQLTDMQYLSSLDELKQILSKRKDDIIGISATFGQQDYLENLIEYIIKSQNPVPLIIVGGSLAALNKEFLLNKYNNIIVATKYGESTIQDTILYWHKKISITDIRNSVYFDKAQGKIIINPKGTDNNPFLGIPELDLLPITLQQKGVMLLETTRGCNSACSFCPRKHKGFWDTSIKIENLLKLTPHIKNLYDRYQIKSRTLFFVDEEFIGNYTDTDLPYLQNKLSRFYKDFNFSYELSARIDQVYDSKKTREYHNNRIKFWKALSNAGLRRCLFGIESGVDTILKRFNKKTTSQQNIFALRILSSLNVPIRLTYITFDPMMSIDELIESYIFQGRKDVFLNPPAYINDDLFSSIQDEKFAIKYTTGEPLYKEISYMLVSLEGLLDSPYLIRAKKQNLVTDYNLLMGRANIRYLDESLELFSKTSQLWVDKIFSLDYTLKGLMKISDGIYFYTLKDLRIVIKQFSYYLLGKLITIYTGEKSFISEFCQKAEIRIILGFSRRWESSKNNEKNSIMLELLQQHFNVLIKEFNKIFHTSQKHIPLNDIKQISDVLRKWTSLKNKWELINHCDTI